MIPVAAEPGTTNTAPVTTPTRFAHLPSVLLLCVLAYAGLLRFDAIALKYDHVAQPRWLATLQDARVGASRIRPAAIRWRHVPRYPHKDGPPTQYVSDPYTYLNYGREMHSFYAAHRREPLFPFATKLMLLAVGQHDTAVSFASATFSWLTVLGAFLLGAAAVSPWIGLGAALGVAIEYDVVSLAVGGWRDDAFACAFVFFAWALVRQAAAPSWRRASVVGLLGAAACLTRITAMTFVVGGLAWLVLTSGSGWTRRLQFAALSASVCAVFVAPFLVNVLAAVRRPSLFDQRAHGCVPRHGGPVGRAEPNGP